MKARYMNALQPEPNWKALVVLGISKPAKLIWPQIIYYAHLLYL